MGAGAQLTSSKCLRHLLFFLMSQTRGIWRASGSRQLKRLSSLPLLGCRARRLENRICHLPRTQGRMMELWPLPTLWEVYQNSSDRAVPTSHRLPHTFSLAWRGQGRGQKSPCLSQPGGRRTPCFCRTLDSHTSGVSVLLSRGSQPGAVRSPAAPTIMGRT